MLQSDIAFKYSWRPYQARVLKEIDAHLDDRHLHIVAAPGSGKTVLGLEVMLRLQKPTLILAPTLAIRNQWADRFVELFIDAKKRPDWISFDPKNPKRITISTYQGLHSALSGMHEEEELDITRLEEASLDSGETEVDYEATPGVHFANAEIPENLKNLGLSDEQMNAVLQLMKEPASEDSDSGTQEIEHQESQPKSKNAKNAAELIKKYEAEGIKTLIVDEAHHLRSEWWESLNWLKASLTDLTIVALTATPPYDAPPAEWQRYNSFCGPIDAEVAAPELVAHGTLCPHQDRVYLTVPTQSERVLIGEYKKTSRAIVTQLKADTRWTQLLLTHPVIVSPKQHVDTILEYPSYYTALGLYLVSAGVKEGHKLLKLIAGRNVRFLPKFDERQAEIFLTTVLYQDPYILQNAESLIEEWQKLLRKQGSLERRRVMLSNSPMVARLIRNSLSKLNAITRIYQFEQSHLKNRLRCVILTDYIRKEYIPEKSKFPELNMVGVIPIFESIRRSSAEDDPRIAVLSGTIVVLPQSIIKIAENELRERTDNKRTVSFSEYPGDKRFSLLRLDNANRAFMVSAITALFEAGEINLIVGTKSLLGEGWDAPSLNTLVLASFVGSTVLSNQMRGRAVRVSPQDPNKVAIIWHLATAEIPDPSIFKALERLDDLGHEYGTLERRFHTYVGISEHDPIITSGIERIMMLPKGPYQLHNLPELIEQANHQTNELDRDRAAVASRWKDILGSGKTLSLVHTIAVKQPQLPKRFIFSGTIQAAVMLLIYNLLTVPATIGQIPYRGHPDDYLILGILFFIGLAYFGIKFLRLMWLSLRHATNQLSMERIGEALLISLFKAGFIKTPTDSLQVIAQKDSDGMVTCGLKGGTTYENDLFLDALSEIVMPIENPRYLIARKHPYQIWAAADFHAVPNLIGRQKKTALSLLREWRWKVGRASLIYTRTEQGRKVLLKARRKSLVQKLSSRQERRTRWQ